MIDLADCLRRLIDHLAQAHSFDVGFDQASVRRSAITYADSACPVALFLAWLERWLKK